MHRSRCERVLTRDAAMHCIAANGHVAMIAADRRVVNSLRDLRSKPFHGGNGGMADFAPSAISVSCYVGICRTGVA